MPMLVQHNHQFQFEHSLTQSRSPSRVAVSIAIRGASFRSPHIFPGGLEVCQAKCLSSATSVAEYGQPSVYDAADGGNPVHSIDSTSDRSSRLAHPNVTYPIPIQLSTTNPSTSSQFVATALRVLLPHSSSQLTFSTPLQSPFPSSTSTGSLITLSPTASLAMATSGLPPQADAPQPNTPDATASSSKTISYPSPIEPCLAAASVADSPPPKKKRSGRERVRIALAPDQPPTTQGKQRERVYVACVQCRSRKIRCDGARPMCHNCRHRVTGRCDYDPVPKRRGPDRLPGSRQRPGRTSTSGPIASAKSSDSNPDGESRDVDQFNGKATSDPPQRPVEKAIKVGRSRTRPWAVTEPPVPPPPDSGEILPKPQDLVAPTADSNFTPVQQGGFNLKATPAFAQIALSSVHLPEEAGGNNLTTPLTQTQVPHYQTPVSIPSVPPIGALNAEQRIDGLESASHTDFGHLDHPGNYEEQQLLAQPQPTGAPDLLSQYAQFTQIGNVIVGVEQLPKLSSERTLQFTGQELDSSTPLHAQGQTGNITQPLLFDANIEQQNGNFTSMYTVPLNYHSRRSSHAETVVDVDNYQASSASPDSYFSKSTPEYAQYDDSFPEGQSYYTIRESYHMPSEGRQSEPREELSGGNTIEEVFDIGMPVSNLTTTAQVPYHQFDQSSGLVSSGHPELGCLVSEVEGWEIHYGQNRRSCAVSITPSPSLEFIRKTWWDALLDSYAIGPFGAPSLLYFDDPLYRGTYLDTSQSVVLPRAEVSRIITRDIQFLFKHSNYWFAFINVPMFFSSFYDPRTRDEMQPALVLAILALSNFLRSSEAQSGARGREKALWFRDRAQATLDASINAQWIEPGLAQAAWLLCLFEISAHPLRSNGRCTSSFSTLDSIIRTLSLTQIDAEDPSASAFRPRSVPRVLPPHGMAPYHAPQPPYPRNLLLQGGYPTAPMHTGTFARHSTGIPVELSPPSISRGCSCFELSHGRVWPYAQEHTPLWMFTPAWRPDWTPMEIRKEECRRLVWSTLTLIAGYTTYRSAMGLSTPNFCVMQAPYYRLLFPGENLSPLLAKMDGQPVNAKDTVWALYARSMLLWHSCLRMREEEASNYERAQFASAVWQEAKTIEEALNRHTCGAEKAFLYQGREFLFNARMYISYEYTRFVPHPTTELSGIMHKQMAEEWFRHQANVAAGVMQGLHKVTGQKNNILAQRPFFVYWFMSQIARCLQLWELDKTQRVPVELSKQFLPPIDYLTALWPCDEQRRLYKSLRRKLEDACHQVGVSPPAQATITIPRSAEALV